jgi:uncharacterized protein (TIGR02246 family)
MRVLRTLPLVLIASVLAAQAPAPEAAKAAKPARRVRKAKADHAEPGVIAQELNARFCKAMEAGDAGAMAALYTEDAELHMGKDTFKGREGIKAFGEGFLKATLVRSATVTSTAAHRKGNTITDTGTFTFQVDDHGKTSTMSGTYVQMLWRGKDGQWRLHRDWPFPGAPAK